MKETLAVILMYLALCWVTWRLLPWNRERPRWDDKNKE